MEVLPSVAKEITNFINRCQKEVNKVGYVAFGIVLLEPGYYSYLVDPISTGNQLLNISLKCSYERYQHNLQKMNSLVVTPSDNNKIHHVYQSYPIYPQKVIEYGLFKNEKFDELLKYLRIQNPAITTEAVAIYGKNVNISQYYNRYQEEGKYMKDFVEERLYNGEEDCLTRRSVMIEDREAEPTHYSVEFAIIAVDLERNSDLLVEILNGLLSPVKEISFL
jgi:hypothetical protein